MPADLDGIPHHGTADQAVVRGVQAMERRLPPELTTFPSDGLCVVDGTALCWGQRITVTRELRRSTDGIWIAEASGEHLSDGEEDHAYCPSCNRIYEPPDQVEFLG